MAGPRRWRTYEQVAAHLLNEVAAAFGLKRVEGKQRVRGRSGARRELDAKGVRVGDEMFVIVECKRWLSRRVSQGEVDELAFRIIDTGADGGILVSPLGLQEGAARIAAARQIHEVRLNADADMYEYILHFLDVVRVGLPGESWTMGHPQLLGGSLEVVTPEKEQLPTEGLVSDDTDRRR